MPSQLSHPKDGVLIAAGMCRDGLAASCVAKQHSTSSLVKCVKID